MLPRFYLASADAQLDFLRHYSMMPEAIFSRVLGQLQFGFYMVVSFRTLARYQRAYVENYADSSNRTYRWLFRLTVSLAGLHVLVLVKEVSRFTPYQALFKGLELWVGLNATVILCWWLLEALHHPDLFRSIDSRIEPLKLTTVPEARLSESNSFLLEVTTVQPVALPEEVQPLVRRLRNHMEQVQPYPDPSLTI